MSPIRSVTVGKEFVYLGKTLGNVAIPSLKFKGSPESYVDACMKTVYCSREEFQRRLEELALYEEWRNPIEVGKKMGHNVFWRLALAYYKNLMKPKATNA